MSGTRPVRLGSSLMLACLVGCNQLIGIEEAHVDPSLEKSRDEPLDGTVAEAGARGESTSSAGTTSDDAAAAGGSSSSGTSSGAGGGSGGDSTGGAGGGSGGHASNTGGASGDSESSGDGSGGTLPMPETSMCDDYCDSIMEECTGENLQYRDVNQCMTLCEMLEEGTRGETGENTVGCRLKFVGDARYGAGTELAAYCRRAGPGGDGACGDNCDGFCRFVMQVCTEDSSRGYHFESEDQCLDACDALPPGEYGYEASGAWIADSNSVECRLFHVASAAMLDPEEHCEHAMGVTLCEEVLEE